MYSKEQVDKFKEIIIAELAEGRSLKKILEENEGMPARPRVYEWLNPSHHFFDETFYNNYAKSREESAERNAEQIEDIANELLYEGKYTHERARVAIDALKWTAGVKKPKKYGKKIDYTTDGEKVNSNIVVYLPHNDREDSDVN